MHVVSFLYICKIVYSIDFTQYADPSALTSEDVSDHGAEEEETETKFWKINNLIMFFFVNKLSFMFSYCFFAINHVVYFYKEWTIKKLQKN